MFLLWTGDYVGRKAREMQRVVMIVRGLEGGVFVVRRGREG
jgi:hypothetical protein